MRGIGEVHLGPLGALKEVLHVEDLQANLISIQKLVDYYGWRFVLDSDACFLCDKVSGRKISSFRREGGLILLESSSPRCMVSQRSSSKEERVILLHRRMGHPPFDLLRTLYPTLFQGIFEERLFCNACHSAKLRRSSFKLMDDRCLSPFECIHSDVWGPCPVDSLTGCQYFVIFVDDYSRTMWLYLLKLKVEVPQVIIQFCRLISNQFGKTVKRFRTDNGTEYFNSKVKTYFMDNGIIHESSCVGTPQQNGLAERRMGYILATARSLLFQANMSKRYWGEAVLTAAHLINRIPMKVIEYDSPLSRLKKAFPTVRLFSGLPARSFGCAVFVHQDIGKLEPRGLKCVFIGYSGTQKGYRCYHLPSQRFFTSADVVFNEEETYFTQENDCTTDPSKKEQVDLEFLRYWGQVQISEPKRRIEVIPNNCDTESGEMNQGAEIEVERQTIHEMTEDDDNDEGDNSLQATEVEDVSTSEVQDTLVDDDLSWPIALRKGVRTCRTDIKYPISQYVRYEKLG